METHQHALFAMLLFVELSAEVEMPFSIDFPAVHEEVYHQKQNICYHR
jgi:hypothetical protein